MYASKNRVIDTDSRRSRNASRLTLHCSACSIREIFGNGTWFGMAIPVLKDNNISIMTMAPGGFFVFGYLMALVNKITKMRTGKKKESGCAACPMADACGASKLNEEVA
jgi:electron transport complex protein RnfE